jgi:hypothetical protein
MEFNQRSGDAGLVDVNHTCIGGSLLLEGVTQDGVCSDMKRRESASCRVPFREDL